MKLRLVLFLVSLIALSAAPSHAQTPRPQAIASTKVVHDTPEPIKADLKGARELYLVVSDGGDGYVADWAEWIEPTLIKADGSKLKLTDLKPKSARVGYQKLGVNSRSDDGKPMMVKGQPVVFGFFAHAPSLIAFDLPEGVIGFEARGGIDDGGVSQGNGATVRFLVFAQNPGDQAIADSKGSASRGVDERYGKAKENMKTFKTAEGLAASLFAAEPMVQNPTNIDIDHRGRVWTLEAVNYRSSFQKWGILRPEGDRVVILEDTNADGVADNETVFWQTPDLQAPLGLCVLPQAKGTQVIVSAAPNVWLLTDTDGDDKADKVDKLFTVGGNWDHDHEVHAFTFGADGKFYFNFGNESQTLKDASGKVIVDLAGNEITNKGKPYRQGMVFRCDIDLATARPSNVETLGWNFRNNYEVCVDSFGTMWQSDNDDDGNQGVRINYVMEYGNYGFSDEITGAGWRSKRTNLESEIPLRHWHLNDPGVVPNLLQTGGGSPTGILINEGSGLGLQFTNQLIHCDAGPRTVRAYPVQNDGAGYKATMVDVLTSSDSWYRPADVAIAPDGALFVADWYDPGVGGHNMGDHLKGKILGRVYRVATSGVAASVPKIDVSTAAGAAAALQSPNRATQYLAWTTLHAMGATAEPELLKLWQNENQRLRGRALGLLAQIKGRETKYLTAGLTDPDPNLRVWAVRLSTMLAKSRDFDTTPLEENRELMTKIMRDPSPQVRRQIAVSLSGAKDIAQLWVALARQHDGHDRWYLEALGIGARGNEDACFEAWLAAVGENWNTPAGRDLIWRARSARAVEYLAKIIADSSIPQPELPRYLRAFDFLPAGPEKTKTLVQMASRGSGKAMVPMEALQRLKGVDMNSSPELKNALSAMLSAASGTPQFVELVRDFNLKDQGEGLLKIAVKEPASSAGVEAARMLLATEYTSAIERSIKSADALKLVQALGNTADRRAVPIILSVMSDPNRDAGIRKQAVQSLTQSAAGVQALLKLAREGGFPQELTLTASTALSAVQFPELKGDIAQFFPTPNALGGQALPPIPELVKLKGDAVRGKTLLEKAETTCITCHRVGTMGVDFGPALTEIGSKLGKDALYESILNPNAGVSMGFETWQITLKNGDAAFGTIRSETESELVLAMPQGIQNRYLKSEIAKRDKLATSLMPSGLQQALNRQDLIDLVEYLATLKKS